MGTAPTTAVARTAGRALDQTGGMVALAAEGFRRTWDVRSWWREWLDQCWFLARVTTLPVLLIAVPLGATISRDELERALEDGNSLATRTAALLDTSGDDLSCAFGGLSSVAANLGRPEVLAALQSLLGTAPDAHLVFEGPDSIVAWEDDGPYIRAIPPLNVGGTDPVPVYPEPRVLPEVQGVDGCPELPAVGTSGGADPAGPGATPEVDRRLQRHHREPDRHPPPGRLLPPTRPGPPRGQLAGRRHGLPGLHRPEPRRRPRRWRRRRADRHDRPLSQAG